MKNRKRYKRSSAYIDSGMISAGFIGVLIFAFWIGFETREAIAWWWLSLAIVTITVYQMMIFWLIKQYNEVDKIFGIFISNLLCLSLILILVNVAIDVQLPIGLPTYSIFLYLYGYAAFSTEPGVVALSYGALGLLSGAIVACIYHLVDDTSLATRVKHWLRLDEFDLLIDLALDRFSLWIDTARYSWVVVPQILLVIVLTIVIGLALFI